MVLKKVMVLKVKDFGTTSQIWNRGQYSGIGRLDITMRVIIGKEIVEGNSLSS